MRGHLEVLKWACANGCPWNKWTCIRALEGGHLELFRWAFANGAPCDGDTVQLAKEKGYVEEDWEAILAPRVVPMGAR